MGTKHTDTNPPPPAAAPRGPQGPHADDGIVWAAARIRGVVTLAVRDGDHATAIEVVPGGVVRLRQLRRTPGGWLVTSEATHDSLCDVEELDVLEAGVPFLPSEAA